MRIFTQVLALAMTLSTAALADDNFTVPAGRATALYDFALWIPDTCSHLGKLPHRIGKKPQHGKVTVLWETSKVKQIPAACKGKIKGLIVVYTPDSGYRGPDEFTITIDKPRYENDGAPASETIRPKITVK